MKIWQKNIDVNQFVESFTVGKDRELDLQMAKFDVLGSLAHTQMLETINLLTAEELKTVQQELKNIYAEIEAGNFTIEDSVEDVHSQVEWLLTQRIGEAGRPSVVAICSNLAGGDQRGRTCRRHDRSAPRCRCHDGAGIQLSARSAGHRRPRRATAGSETDG